MKREISEFLHRRTEPKPLGVDVDPSSAALYNEFAQGRSLDEIYKLWKDPEVINPTIRQRAVTVLTAPYGYSLPYPHTDQGLGRLLNIREDIDGDSTFSLRKRLAGRVDLAEELAAGVLYWIQEKGGRIKGERLDSRSDYLSTILSLLPIVSDETADQLFAHFPINDLEAYRGWESESGYHPLTRVFLDTELPERFKIRSLESWFEVAEKEEAGHSLPRQEHERATIKMAQLVEVLGTVEADDQQKVIISAIVAFLEKVTPPASLYIKGYKVTDVASKIIDPDTRFSFAWRHIAFDPNDGWRGFSINSRLDLELAEWVLEELKKNNISQSASSPSDEAPALHALDKIKTTAFEARVAILIESYQKDRQKRIATQLAEQALWARMRG